MDFNVDKQQLCACRIVREAKSEQGVDSDLTLPDYCPDIKSMLCCSIEPGISSVNITGNRITAEGNAVIRLLYVSADDKLACYEQNYPLSKYVEMNSLNPDWQVTANAKVSYVNCRAVSPRRVDVHGCVSVLFSVMCCESKGFVSSVSGDSVRQKLVPFHGCSATGCVSKLFEMSEVIPLGGVESAVKGVIRSSAVPLINEVKAGNNKLLVKGEMQLCVSLCCENSSVKKVEHTMPISQIIELDGVDDTCICDVKAAASSLDIRLKTDDNGEMQNLDAAVVIRADVCAYKPLNCACVEDVYSVKKELDIKTSPIESDRFAGMLDETFLVSFQPDFTGNEVGEVIDSWCESVTCVTTEKEGGTELSGTITLCVLYNGSDGNPVFTRRQNDYRFSKDLPNIRGNVNGNIAVQPCGTSVNGKGATVNAKVQLRARGCMFESENIMAVTNAEVLENTEKSGSNYAVTVYFGENGEKLWDIAKKYNTSEESIRRRNNISGDVLEKETMLII